MSPEDKILEILEHIKHVQENCYKLGLKLIRLGEIELGRNLIANGQIHDNSKFKGIEFEHLFPGDVILSDVVKHHAYTNAHHPEFWGGIKNMPRLYIAEMVCDCLSRSTEFGSDIRDWFDDVATIKYGYAIDDEISKTIHYFLDLLLTKKFK